MKSHYSAAELAVMSLPGIPGTERGIKYSAEVKQWSYRDVSARGGRTGTRREYAVAALPTETQHALLSQSLAPFSSTVPQGTVSPADTSPPVPAGLFLPEALLTDKQRAERDARAAILQAIKRLQTQSGCSLVAAITTLLTTARAGRLDPAIDSLLRLARDPRGRNSDGYPSERTLKRWLAAPNLVPKVTQKDMSVPPWAKPLMTIYGAPQKPSLAACVEQLPMHLPPGVKMPSYDACARFLRKMGNVERQRGRMLSREIKTLLPFVRRDASGMTPDTIYTADGHTFDAEVAHPKHGRPFRPEITTVLSVPTRRCVGWSVGLAESTWCVMDALRHAVTSGGIPSIWYVDNGSGYKNMAMADEVVGFAARLGISIEHSLPYNSQARGVEERSHKSILVRAAKKLPTYIGADMDPQAKQKVFKLTRADVKATGTSRHLLAFNDFLQFLRTEIDAYNARPHSSLPKIFDAALGRKRHMSPDEAWQQAIDAGWSPMKVSGDEADHLFRPEIIATTTRGEVRCLGHLYFSSELQEYTGDQVRVGYDIHDASRVWVRDMEGRLLAIAEFEANKRRYFPESTIERADRRRMEGRLQRLEAHADEVREELAAPALLEHQQTLAVPILMPSPENTLISEESTQSNVRVLPSAEARPWFQNDPDRYRWLMRNPAQWDAEDAAWLLDYVSSDDYTDLSQRYEFQGVAWGADDAQRAKTKLDFEVAAR